MGSNWLGKDLGSQLLEWTIKVYLQIKVCLDREINYASVLQDCKHFKNEIKKNSNNNQNEKANLKAIIKMTPLGHKNEIL